MLIKVNTSDLKIGMFISELDRPWLDTPFLIQGFLIDDISDIARLRLYCQYVYADTRRSAAGVLPNVEQHKRQARKIDDALSNTGRFMRMVHSNESGATVARHYHGKPDPGNERSLGNLGKQLFGRLFGRHSRTVLLPAPIRHDFVPPAAHLVAHPETHTVEQEFSKALEVFDGAKYVMSRMVADLLAGKTTALDKVQEVINEIVESMLRNPDALMWVAMTKQQDATLYGHGIRVAVYMVAMGRHIGLDRDYLGRLGMVGALLDIGKTTLPLSLLTKPGQLTDDEFDLVKGHVNKSLELIEGVTKLHPDIKKGIAQHHEREDGSGYPHGLAGKEIGLFGRMAAIVDAFVALTNERTYAKPLPPYDALRKLTEWSRTLFHAQLTEQLIQAIGVFPVGSIVELSTNEVAVVIRQNRAQRLKPHVLVVRGPYKKPLPEPVYIDLLEEKPATGAVIPLHIARGLPAGTYGIDGRDLKMA